MKTKTIPLMVCLIAIIATGSSYLISNQLVRLPDLMFSIIFGVCGVWMLLAATSWHDHRLGYFFASICLAATAVLVFWSIEHHPHDIAACVPFISAQQAYYVTQVIFWGGGCICARLSLLLFLYGIKKWKQPPILPLIIIRYFIKRWKKASDKNEGAPRSQELLTVI